MLAEMFGADVSELVLCLHVEEAGSTTHNKLSTAEPRVSPASCRLGCRRHAKPKCPRCTYYLYAVEELVKS